MTQAPATPELVERLRDQRHVMQGDGLAALLATTSEAAAALEAQQARIAELEVENERLRLTMLGGEDVAGFASSLPLAQVLDSFRTYETALRDNANSAQALADRYEKALAYIAENDRSYLVAPTPGAKGYPGHYGHVARQALSSQGRHEGGEDSSSRSQPCGVGPSDLTDPQSQHSDGEGW